MSDHWEIYALKYAERNERTRADSFLMDPYHDSQHDMDYFIWLLKNDSKTILVDTGYDLEEGKSRNRPILQAPSAMLEDFGSTPDSISDIILTHLHYDHAGSLKEFPNAVMHLQEEEMRFATGPCMCSDHIRMPFTGEHVCDVVRSLYAGRLNFSNGSNEIAPGVEVHLIGGHSRGLQCVRVRTKRGWVVLASDASHYYENYRSKKPFPIVVDMENMMDGFNTLSKLADSDNHIIPGHDPLVRKFYPSVTKSDDRIVALHAEPSKS